MPARLRHLRHRELDGLARDRLDYVKEDLALGILQSTTKEFTVTFDNTTEQLTVAAEDTLAVGNPRVVLSNDGTSVLPAELETGVIYYLADAGVNLYTLHPTKEDASAVTNTIAFTDDGTGTLTINILD